MLAVLATAPPVGADSGLSAAIIAAAGVTALVALVMMGVGLYRSNRLSFVQAFGTAGLALGVIAVSTFGVLAVSPDSARASGDEQAPGIDYVVEDEGPDLQLPTLPLED